MRLFGKIDGRINSEDRPFFYSGVFTGVGWLDRARKTTDWDKTDKTDATWGVASQQTGNWNKTDKTTATWSVTSKQSTDWG